jgi:hypothetical protein
VTYGPKLDSAAPPFKIGRMSAAEKIAPTIAEPLLWAEFCALHPDEWVCLVEVEHETEGAIRSARVVGHHRSIKDALKQVDSWGSHPVVTYAHTGGRRLRFPRIVRTDEIRELVRIRR